MRLNQWSFHLQKKGELYEKFSCHTNILGEYLIILIGYHSNHQQFRFFNYEYYCNHYFFENTSTEFKND